jgi:ectoine hydroxylase-related dioxygenase (phytanoyl-CoA dioxygenase family)
MTDLKNHFLEIEEVGYTTVKQIISPQEVTALKDTLISSIDKDNELHHGKPNKIDDYVVDLPNYGNVFLNLLDNDIIHNVFSHFLGDTCIVHSYVSGILKPGETNFYSQRIHIDEPRIIPNYHLGLLMALALDDFTEENGATWNIPASQTMTKLPSEEYFDEHAVQATRKAGDALFWNPRVVHRAGHNTTDKTRHMISLHASRSFVKQRLDYPRLIQSQLIEQSSDRVKGFLGFNVRVPSNMDEYYVPTEQRLYKPNQG